MPIPAPGVAEPAPGPTGLSLMSRHSRACVALAALALSGLLTTGCSVLKQPTPPPFDVISIEGAVRPLDEDTQRINGTNVGRTRLRNSLVAAGVLGTAGGITGVGLAAAGCGPSTFLFPVCFVVVGPAFGGIGFASGALVGTGVGIATGLQGETATRLTNASIRVQQLRTDLAPELAESVASHLPSEMEVEDTADAHVTVRLDEFDLRQHMGQRVSVRLRASMTQRWPSDEGGERLEKICRYEFQSDRRDADDWAEGNGAALNETLSTSLERFGLWMANDLDAFHKRDERPETDDTPASCYREPRWWRFADADFYLRWFD